MKACSFLRAVLWVLCLLLLAQGTLLAQNASNTALETKGAGYVTAWPSKWGSIPNTFTVEAWVKPYKMPYGYGNVLCRYYNLQGFLFGVFAASQGDSAQLFVRVNDMNHASTKYFRCDSLTWTHIAMTVSASLGRIRLYVNGALSDEFTGSAFTMLTPTDSIRMGNTAYNDPYRGLIDEVRIWNGERTAAAISNLRDYELRGSENNLVAVYHFDDPRDTKVAYNRSASGGMDGEIKGTAPLRTEQDTTKFRLELTPLESFASANFLPFDRTITLDVAAADTQYFRYYPKVGDVTQFAVTVPGKPGAYVYFEQYGTDTTKRIGLLPASTMTTAFSANGLHYLRFGTAGATSATIRMSRTGSVGFDSHEPNDAMTAATPLRWGDTLNYTLFPGVDQGVVADTDWFSFNGHVDDYLLLATSSVSPFGGSYSEMIVDPQGKPLDVDSRFDVNGYKLTTDGTYYFKTFPSVYGAPYRRVQIAWGLVDVQGFLFDPRTTASAVATDLPGGTRDAYDGAYILSVNDTWYRGLPDSLTGPGRREVVTRPQIMSGLTVQRKFFCPTAAMGDTLGFLRIQDILKNETAAPITVNMKVYSDLGSDANTRILSTWSGDTVLTKADYGVITCDTDASHAGTGDPVLLHFFDGPGGKVRVDSIYANPTGTLAWEWNNVTVNPGEKKIFMYFVAQDSTFDASMKAAAFFSTWGSFPALAQVGLANDGQYIQNWAVPFTAVDEKPAEVPEKFGLAQNYPNPFNPATTIGYTVGGIGDQGSGISNVKLTIYNLLGQEVVTLVNERQAPGRYTVHFDGSRLASGMYLYRLQAGSFVETKRMLLLK